MRKSEKKDHNSWCLSNESLVNELEFSGELFCLASCLLPLEVRVNVPDIILACFGPSLSQAFPNEENLEVSLRLQSLVSRGQLTALSNRKIHFSNMDWLGKH